MFKKDALRQKRKLKIRKNVFGVAKKPRVSVFRSNRYISVQAIDDVSGITVCFASDKEIKEKSPKVDKAKKVGEILAKKLQEKGIESVVFDRNGYKYHGRVKAIAESLRESKIRV